MTWIRTISDAEATGAVAETFALMRERTGAVSNITRAASIKPGVMRALVDLLHALRGPDCALGKRRQEMVAVLTSALHRCAY